MAHCYHLYTTEQDLFVSQLHHTLTAKADTTVKCRVSQSCADPTQDEELLVSIPI